MHKTYFKFETKEKIMKNKFKIAGLWIPYQILTDKNLSDKVTDDNINDLRFFS